MASWTWNGVVLSVAIVWIINRWLSYRKKLAQLHYIPGIRLLFNPYRYARFLIRLLCAEADWYTSLVGYLLPPVKGLFLGSIHQWDDKYSREFELFCNQLHSLTSPLVFQELKRDIYTSIGFLSGSPGYQISDPNVVKVSQTMLADNQHN